jgi:uncharacterized protein YukE
MQPGDGRTPMESRWEKSKHAFERILEDSQRATETLMRTLDELGQRTKARVEKARLQRRRRDEWKRSHAKPARGRHRQVAPARDFQAG